MPQYHFHLPDGQVFATTNLRQLRKEHPDATITGRVETDEAGNSILRPYQGKQPWEDNPDEEVEPESAPGETQTSGWDTSPVTPLGEQSVTALRKQAQGRQITGYTGMDKNQLVAALEAANAEQVADTDPDDGKGQ